MFESIVIFAYFCFLFGLLYASRNVDRIAEHPTTKAVVEKFTYNLRDLPRVDYKEFSSDESEPEQEQEQVESPMDVDSESDSEGLRRRDRNPLGRMIEAST